MTKPTWEPPEGTHWELQQGVELYSGDPSVSALNLPPGYDPGGSFHANFDGITSYGMGSDYGLAGAQEYAFDRWRYAQFQMYVDGSPTELMAAEPTADSGSQCTTIFAGETLSFLDPGVGHTTAWPWRWQFTWHSHSHAVAAGSLGVAVVKIVGDVWTAMLGVDGYEEISGVTPVDTPIDPCPPDCGQNTPIDPPPDPPDPTSPPGAGLPPAAANEGLVVRWGRNEGRVVWDVPLGCVGGLTWDVEFGPNERSMVLDGVHYVVERLPNGGHSQQAEYRWAKLPGTDAQGRRLWFTLDVSELDDPVAVLR